MGCLTCVSEIARIIAILPFYVAGQVLDRFRERFIAEMNALTVSSKFLADGILPPGDHESISKTSCPKLRNEILHLSLKRTCTEEALMKACGVIIAVEGNSKMTSVGKDMLLMLETGVCVCICVVHVSVPLPHVVLQPSVCQCVASLCIHIMCRHVLY